MTSHVLHLASISLPITFIAVESAEMGELLNQETEDEASEWVSAVHDQSAYGLNDTLLGRINHERE